MEQWETGVKEKEKKGKEEKSKHGGLEVFSSLIVPQSPEPNACIYVLHLCEFDLAFSTAIRGETDPIRPPYIRFYLFIFLSSSFWLGNVSFPSTER
jgi:hypothetical protein